MKFTIKKETEKRNDLMGRKAKATFLMLNMGINTSQAGWWVEEEKEGRIIYADIDKVTILTDKGVPMCFKMNEVVIV